MSFRSLKSIYYLNFIRYHGVSIENTYYHQSPSIVTQSIGVYNHFRVSPINQNLLLILSQTQYSLKVESSCNIVAWWIMAIDSLVSWFIIGPIQCATHALVWSPWENHPDNQDNLSVQLRGSVLQSQMDNLNPWTNYGQLITLQGTHDLDLLGNS